MSDYDSDKYSILSEDDEPNQKYINIIPDLPKTMTKEIMTTEGITKQNNLKNVTQCSVCVRFYNNDFTVNDEVGNMCKHCLFWLNYDEKGRFEFDKKCANKGFGIAEYILECHEIHDPKKCIRQGGCYLCDYKSGLIIKNIMNPDLLPNNKIDDKTNTVNIDEYDDVKFNSDICYKLKIPTKLTL